MSADRTVHDLLNRAVATLEPRTDLLVTTGVARGRTLRRRRRITQGATGVALAAMIAAIAVAAWPASSPASSGTRSPAGHPAASRPVVSHSAAPSRPAATTAVMSPQLVLKTALALLPGAGTTSTYTGRSLAGWAGAEFVYDDGNGRAEVAVSFTFPQDGTTQAQPPCTPGDASSTALCTVLDDGSHLAVVQAREYSYPHDPNATEWSVDLVRPDGAEVQLSEWNAPQEKDAAVSRPSPPFTVAQLTTIARSPRWTVTVNRSAVDSAAGLFRADPTDEASSAPAVPPRCAKLLKAGKIAAAKACTVQASAVAAEKRAMQSAAAAARRAQQTSPSR